MGTAKYESEIFSKKLVIADTFLDRLVGLMFKSSMGNKDALLIKNCNSIHTFFMSFSIDVVFLNSKNEVIKPYYDLKPWRMTRMVWGATQVLEMRAGDLPRNLEVGDRLEICIS